MHGKVFKGGSRNSATFKMEFLATIGNGRNLQRASSDGLTTNRQYLHVAVVTRPSLQPKLKTNENSHAWKVAPDTLSCFVDMFFYIFSKTPITFCLTNILFQFKTGIIVDFVFGGSTISSYWVPEVNIRMWSKKCC